MARQRIIHPGFFTDGELLALSPLHRLLFAGLWCWADRAGRLEDKPIEIKIRVLPVDQCDVNTLLGDLAGVGRLVRYTAAGKRYIEIVNFTRYQNPHPKEKSCVIPGPSTETYQLHGETGNSTASRVTVVSSPAVSDPVSDPVSVQTPEPAPLGPVIAPQPTGDLAVRGSSPPRKEPGVDPEAICASWNEICGDVLAKVETLTQGRKGKLRTRGAEPGRTVEWWQAYFRRIRGTPFLCGAKGWRANFDFVIKSEDIIAKIMEGGYDHNATGPPGKSGGALPPAPSSAYAGGPRGF